jgi:FOG: GAF domain
MATRTMGDPAQHELGYRKRLIEIANLINSAPSITEILVDIKDKMLGLVDAERVTIFALDTKNQELFSLVKAGTEVKEIRVPKTFGSIAGFTALSRKTANIKNAYDPAELTRLHPNLKFDSRWDKAGNFRTGQVLATPILFEKYLLGVLQLINKRSGGSFSPKDEEAAEELSKILGIASTTSTAPPAATSRRSTACSWTRASSPRRTSRTRSATRASTSSTSPRS